MVHIGFQNYVAVKDIIAITSASSSPIKKLIKTARQQNFLIDATCGRKTNSVIFTGSGHLITSFLTPEKITKRIQQKEDIEQ